MILLYLCSCPTPQKGAIAQELLSFSSIWKSINKIQQSQRHFEKLLGTKSRQNDDSVSHPL